MGVHLIFDIFFFIFSVIVLFYLFKIIEKTINYKSEKLLDLIKKNNDLLDICIKKNNDKKVINSISVYNKLLTILKISNANSVMLFKYNYNKKFILFNFLLSINNDDELYNENITYELPVTSNKIVLDILESNNSELRQKKVKNKILSQSPAKIYYKNIYKDNLYPYGFIILSYKDFYYNISNDEAQKIEDIIEDINYII